MEQSEKAEALDALRSSLANLVLRVQNQEQSMQAIHQAMSLLLPEFDQKFREQLEIGRKTQKRSSDQALGISELLLRCLG